MAKDPAFLFYPGDWLSGTLGMTFEEKGAYLELLILQFNRGHMTEHMIGQIVGQLWVKLKDKFTKDDAGLWYNVRLEEEKIKRQKFTESRRNNVLGVNQYTKKNKKESGHMTYHMENENEDINKDIDLNKNKVYSQEIFTCYNNCLKYFSEELHPKKENIKNKWLDTIDKLNRIDKIPFELIEEIVKRTREDAFWSKNFLSINKLRQKDKNDIPYITVFFNQFKPKNNGQEYSFEDVFGSDGQDGGN